jgi:hypothetical protein
MVVAITNGTLDFKQYEESFWGEFVDKGPERVPIRK